MLKTRGRGLKFWLMMGFVFGVLLPTAFAENCAAECSEPQNGCGYGSMFSELDRMDRLEKPVSVGRDIEISFGGELRYRFELKDDHNFSDATFEDDYVHLLRSRLSGEIKWRDFFTGFVQIQDAHGWGERSAAKNSATTNEWDLHQLYGLLRSPDRRFPVSVKVGRQVLSYGDQRFIGAFDWSNVARVFDAVKIIYHPADRLQLDAWISQVVPVNRSQFDSANHSENFWGLYVQSLIFSQQHLDFFYLVRHMKDNELRSEVAGRLGQRKVHFTGSRFSGVKGRFDYELEGGYQFGSYSHDRIRAFGLHSEIGFLIPSSVSTRANAEYNFGSGDGDSSDGTHESFDNFYPTNHLHYGYMDFNNLSNIHDLKFGLEVKPHDEIKFETDYHFFWLASNKSPWTNASGAVMRAAAAGASKHLGSELDLLWSAALSSHVDLLIGYSIFFPGPFVKDTGGGNEAAHFFYVQPKLRFG